MAYGGPPGDPNGSPNTSDANIPADPRLRNIIGAWEASPEAIKAAAVALFQVSEEAAQRNT